MSPARVWLVVAASFSCGDAPTVDARDVCASATALVQSCGVTVPLLTDGPCTGLARFASQCITSNARDCDELAVLAEQLDRCLPDAGDVGDDLELPVAAHDAGTSDAGLRDL